MDTKQARDSNNLRRYKKKMKFKWNTEKEQGKKKFITGGLNKYSA